MAADGDQEPRMEMEYLSFPWMHSSWSPREICVPMLGLPSKLCDWVCVEFYCLKGGRQHFFSKHSDFIISDKKLKELLQPEGRTKRTGTSSAAVLLFQPHGYVDFSDYAIHPVPVGGWGSVCETQGEAGR